MGLADETSTHARPRVELRLTLRDAEVDRNVAIDADWRARVSALVEALAAHAGVTPHGVLFTDRLGRLRGDVELGASGLLDGDVISLSGPVASRATSNLGSTAPAATLVVMGGPAAGLRIGLAPGRYVVGRDAAADVPIADASLSRAHFTVDVGADGTAHVSDAGSSNGTAVEGVRIPADTAKRVAPAEAIEAGRSTFTCEPWRAPSREEWETDGARVLFNRKPRVGRGYEAPTLRLDAPPAPMRAIRIPLIVAFVPVFMGVALFLLTNSPIMLMMAAFSPLMMIGSSMSEKRSGRKEHIEQTARFKRAVQELETELVASRSAEQIERRAAAPHAGDLAARAIQLLPTLWERKPIDKDFLDLRLGVADQPSIVAVSFAPGGDSPVRADVDKTIASFQTVPVVPVHVRMTEVGAIGLVGDDETVDAVGRWVMTQFATLQSPRDVVITAALSQQRAAAWRWLTWLPHVDHPASGLDGEGTIAVGQQAARDLLRRVSTLADERRQESDGRKRTRRRTTIVVLVDEEVAPEGMLVDALLDNCADIDVVVVWLAQETRHLPGGCNVIVETSSERAVADVTWRDSGRVVREASLDALAPQITEAIARSLAPVEDITAGGGMASVPRTVTLVELLGLVEPTPAQITARWKAQRGSGLSAVIGASSDGPYSLDLRHDGPHALVAGTTGAGKSELLQTLIVALAAAHRPDRVAFLLVDYKGGAAFKDCARLPHSVGMVTDLDEHQVHRALISLNAELKRREHVLKAAETRDLMELQRRDPASAPPSLVIVIDEFATLAKEMPSFVDGVVDVAQRGRSLGVHLVLATQRPGSAVTENIRANTELKIALRVAGVAESDDVIGAPDAARLPRSMPGRALVRIGSSELELIQAGYVGGRTRSAARQRAIEIRDIGPRSRRTPEGGTPITDEETDLQLLVEAIGAATAQLGITPARSPWLKPLAPAVKLGELTEDDDPGKVAIGLVDDPAHQRQMPFTLDLPSDGSVLIFGTGGAGKTTTLRTIATALARTHHPRDLNIYGIDCAGRGLQPLEALPHCGSVIPGEDEERVAKLISLLRRTIDSRSILFADRHVADLADFQRQHPDEPLPRIVVLLDSYAGFTEIYDRIDLGRLVDLVPRLVADGRTAGVHLVITADRRAAVPAAVASLIAARLVLRMANEDEYLMLGLKPATTRGAVLPPGRGFGADELEVQVATLAGTVEARAEATALAQLAERLSADADVRCPPLAPLPRRVDARELPAATRPLTAPFAIDDLDFAPISASLADSHFVVIGPYRSGRSTALYTIASALRATTPGLKTHLLVPRRSWLPEQTGWDSVSDGVSACEETIATLLDELLARARQRPRDPLLIVLDDAGELAESHIASSLETLIKRGRDAHVRCVMSLETGHARHYAAWIREIRKDGRGMLLAPNLDLDGELLAARLPRRSNAVFPPGRGYVVHDGTAVLAQVATAPRAATI